MYRKITIMLVAALCLIITAPFQTLQAKQQNKISFQSKSTFFGSHLQDVIYANGQYVAVGEDGTILHSKNGMDWTFAKSGVKGMLQAIAYGNGLFVAVGDDQTVLTSKDGVAWKKQKFTLSSKTVSTLKGSSYVPEFAHDYITTSTGIIWDGKQFVMHTEFTNYYLEDSNRISQTKLSLISTSRDGVTWSTAQISDYLFDSARKLKYIKGVYYLFSNQTIFTSKNLKKWTELPLEGVQDAAIGPKGYVLGIAMREGPYPHAGSMLVTGIQSNVDIGKAKKVIDFGIDGVRSVDYMNGSYVMSMFDGAIAVSSNGTAWTLSYPFAGSGDSDSQLALSQTSNRTKLNKTIWDGKQYITVGDYGTILYSSDLKDFEKGSIKDVAMIAGGNLKGIKYEKGLYFTYGTNGNLFVSRDGTEWSSFLSTDTDGAVNRISSSDTIEDAAFNGRDFALITFYTYNAINFSAEAVYYPESGSLQNSPLEAFNVPYDVKWKGGSIVARFKDGNVHTFDTATGKWSTSGTSKDQRLDNSVLKASGNGTTVKSKGLSGSNTSSSTDVSKEELVKSNWLIGLSYLDGKNKWKEAQYTLYSAYELARGKYVLQMDHVHSGNFRINALIYGNKEFVAVGSGGLIIQSKDGKSWTRLESGTYQNLNGVLWDGKQYYIVGDRGVFLTYAP
jgi:hypothetical protein